jgi:capsule polysaccharide export protein KpsE/RkpR
LTQLGAINSVFGNQAAVEVALKVGRSQQVRDIVIKRNDLGRRLAISDPLRLHRWLKDNVEIRSLRGGIIQFELMNRDAALARGIIAAYAAATQERLAQITRGQTEFKRDVLLKLVNDASARLSTAKGAYDSFRLANRSATPEAATQDIRLQVPALEGAIRAKTIEIATASQLYTDENIVMQQLTAERAALQRQLAQVKATDPYGGASLGSAVVESRRGEQLQRELGIAQTLYDNYLRYLEGTSVEDLTSTATVRVLEPPFVDTERQYNIRFAALALAILMLWGAMEVYRWAPPVGERLGRGGLIREQEVHHA